MLNVVRDAQKGDSVFISYSGHGGREKTVVSKWKGKSSEYDETLCPYDVKAGGLSIRDFVLNYVFGLFVEKGIKLTVFLDSCHSGGATRAGLPDRQPNDDNDPPALVRSLPVTSYLEPEITAKEYWGGGKGALYDREEKVREAWEDMIDRTTQSAGAARKKAPGLFKLNPVGYALIAGCLEHELSRENFGAGYLSSAATDALKTLEFAPTPLRNGGVPLRLVHRLVFDQVYGAYRRKDGGKRYLQSPLVLGETEWVFPTGGVRNPTTGVSAGSAPSPIRTGPTVNFPLRVHAIPHSSRNPHTLPSLLLRAGAAHGIVVGSEYAVFRWFDDPSTAPVQVRVVVTEVRELVSVITLSAPLTTLPEDWQALAKEQVRLQNHRREATRHRDTGEPYKPLRKAYPWPMGCVATLLSEPEEVMGVMDVMGGSSPHLSRFNRLLSIRKDTDLYAFDLAITTSNRDGKLTHAVKFTWLPEYASALNKEYANIVLFYFNSQNHSIRKVYPVDGEFESLDAGDTREFTFDDENNGVSAKGSVKAIVFWASSSFDWWQMGPVDVDGGEAALEGETGMEEEIEYSSVRKKNSMDVLNPLSLEGSVSTASFNPPSVHIANNLTLGTRDIYLTGLSRELPGEMYSSRGGDSRLERSETVVEMEVEKLRDEALKPQARVPPTKAYSSDPDEIFGEWLTLTKELNGEI